MKRGNITTLGTLHHTLCDKCVGFLVAPPNHVTLKMHERDWTYDLC